MEASLTLIDQHHLHDGVQRNVHLVRAHAVHLAVGRPIVAVAELLWRNVVQLRDHRRRRRHVRDLIDQRDQVIAAGRHQEPIVRVGDEQLLGPVEEEAERQEDLDVGPLDQHALVALLGVLQVADADGVGALAIADRVEGVEDLCVCFGVDSVGWCGGAIARTREILKW